MYGDAARLGCIDDLRDTWVLLEVLGAVRMARGSEREERVHVGELRIQVTRDKSGEHDTLRNVTRTKAVHTYVEEPTIRARRRRRGGKG